MIVLSGVCDQCVKGGILGSSVVIKPQEWDGGIDTFLSHVLHEVNQVGIVLQPPAGTIIEGNFRGTFFQMVKRYRVLIVDDMGYNIALLIGYKLTNLTMADQDGFSQTIAVMNNAYAKLVTAAV